MTGIKIIIDTDIADDIDDAVALSMALGSPEFDIVGVTVVYGDVDTRARVARKMIRAWGRNDIPVIVGWERPLQFEYHPGCVPEPCSQRFAVAGDNVPLDTSVGAPDFIAACVRRYPGEVHVLTIGAMTNLGAALSMDPALAGMIAGVYSNAGNLPPDHVVDAEWNVRYDPLAGRVISRSGVPWTVMAPMVAAGNLGLGRRELAALASSGFAPAELLAELVVLYRRHKSNGDSSVRTLADVDSAWVSDTNTLFALLFPAAIAFRRGAIDVTDEALLDFREASDGPHRLAFSMIPEAYNAELMDRLLGRKVRMAPMCGHA